MDSDKSPLLSRQEDLNSPQLGASFDDLQTRKKTVPSIGPNDVPPPYSSAPQASSLSNDEDLNSQQCRTSSNDLQDERQVIYSIVPFTGPDYLPPPYNPSSPGVFMIACRVCDKAINITDRLDQRIVTCSDCNEATSIKSAPPGKKYVRCPCNALLLCKSSCRGITCPRSNCKRNLKIDPLPLSVTEMCQVSCVYCRFVFKAFTDDRIRCPQCLKVSSPGSHYSRSRGVRYLIRTALLMLVVAAAFTISAGFLYGCFVNL